MFEQAAEKYLIRLEDSTEQTNYEAIKQKITKFPKFFFDIRSKTLIVYDQTLVYIISREETTIKDLGKQHAIVQVAYNPHRNVMLFLTHDGHLYGHFLTHKTQLLIRKQLKKEAIFGWIYGRDNFDMFIAESAGVRLMKIDEQKKAFKEVKNISGKFNSFLFEPMSQVLVCFPVGDCKSVLPFNFDEEARAKNYFKAPEVPISIDEDEHLKSMVKVNKSLGLKSSRIYYQLFHKQQHEEFEAEVIFLNGRCFIVFYFASEGKLKLVAIADEPEKEITIKLPSDCIPSFNVVDNMLVIHMKNEKITFIYDISNSNAQMLVSPFPVEHTNKAINPYQGVFIGTRHIMPNGSISRWAVNIPVIFYYLKNELQVFDFLLRRQKAKPDLLKWLRENLLRIKQINLSKFWKLIFIKMQANQQKQRDIATITDLYANVFYTLANDELTSKQELINVILECIRQARQLQVKIPYQLQKLIFELLLAHKKYETLVFLCHNDIIKDSQEFVEALMRKATKEGEEILLTLSIDMAQRVCKPQKVFEMLVLSQRVWEARRYLKMNSENIEVLFMIYAAKGIRDQALRREFLRLTRAFIVKKFPTISQQYLDEAEAYVFQPESPTKITKEQQPV